MAARWNAWMDEIRVQLRSKRQASYLPSRIDGGSDNGVENLNSLWETPERSACRSCVPPIRLPPTGSNPLHSTRRRPARPHIATSSRYVLMTSDGRSNELDADFYQQSRRLELHARSREIVRVQD